MSMHNAKVIANDNHRAVMQAEALVGLNIQADGIYVDATFGRGGHAQSILDNLSQSGKLLIIDKDPQAISVAKQLQRQDARVQIFAGSNAKIREFCTTAGANGKVDGILLDLGVSSPQLDTAERGFSFMQDGPLDMRMDPTSGITAAEWLHAAEQTEIEYVLKTYGEEQFARRIAREICMQRTQQQITTTKMLADLIKRCYPLLPRIRKRKDGSKTVSKHPATKSFQAIRIFINNELEDLKTLLADSIALLADYGRLVVISFHSLEDRIVKQFINSECTGDVLPADFPIRHKDLHPRLRKIGKKQRPTLQEIQVNIRARSAVLRVAEKLPSATNVA